MITIEQVHKLVQEHVKLSEDEYSIKFFKENNFRLEGKGFVVNIGSGFINEFRIIQYPFKNLYFGLDFKYHDHTIESITYILKRIRSYLDAFKKMIMSNLEVMA